MQHEEVFKKNLTDLNSIYLAYGEDDYLLEEFVNKFKSTFIEDQLNNFNFSIIKDTNNLVGDIINAVETLPFMADRRVVIIHSYDLFNSKVDNIDQLASTLADFPDTTVALFVSHKQPDKRMKLYQRMKKYGKLLEFNSPQYQQLDDWVTNRARQEGKNITSGAVKLLEEAFSNDLQRLGNELEKAIIFAGEKDTITREDVEKIISQDWLVADNVIFDFVDAIGRKNISRALELLTDILQEGSDPKQILGMIARQVRLMMQTKLLARKGWSAKKIANKLNQHPYPIKKCLKQSKNFTVEALEKAMERLAEADYKLVTGADQEFELELLVIDLKETV